jgi:dihydrolipoyl dehydrogenase
MGELGIELPQPPKFDMSKAVAFTDNVVKRMTSGVGTLMKGNRIDVSAGAPIRAG